MPLPPFVSCSESRCESPLYVASFLLCLCAMSYPFSSDLPVSPRMYEVMLLSQSRLRLPPALMDRELHLPVPEAFIGPGPVQPRKGSRTPPSA